MNNWKVEVYYKPDVPDTVGQGIVEDITDLGISGIESVRVAAVYWIEGSIDAETIDRICSGLLTDPITQTYTYGAKTDSSLSWTIEVQFKPGVTDAVGDSAVKGINDLGITDVTTVKTGHKYWLTGTLTAEIVETIAQQLLMNDVIQTYTYQEPSA
ncbi:MAG: phosphoribosylformylglycinamidine synthase subunit PurS [Candidatus Poribacteria bacterium]|nr:phosphoribosylformylglycinamidine synthase subunit PurS [Candidatus Poribacteria bacterium]